eukprot:UN13310
MSSFDNKSSADLMSSLSEKTLEKTSYSTSPVSKSLDVMTTSFGCTPRSLANVEETASTIFASEISSVMERRIVPEVT